MANILSIQPVLRTLVVKHPGTTRPVGLEIDFRSIDSDEVQAVERRLRTKSLRSGRNSVTVDKLDENEYDILAAVIAGWRWSDGLDLDGDSNPSASRENIEKLFKSAPWIKKQLDEEMRDEAGFFTT